MHLDVYDKRLLLELDRDCRVSFSTIGKALKRSPQFVKYRFEQLVKQRVIQHLYVATNSLHLGYQTLHYFVKFRGKATEEQSFLEYLYTHSLVNVVERLEGYYDYHISFCANDMKLFAQLLQQVTYLFGKYLRKFDNVNDLFVRYFDRMHLTERKMETDAVGRYQELSEVDRKVLSQLVAEPRKRIVDISQDLSLPLFAVRKSIKMVEGLIERYSFVISPAVVDQHIVFLRMQDFSQEQEQKLMQFANLHMNITRYFQTYGTWHVLLYVEIDDRVAFRRLLKEIQFTFQDVIASIETASVYQIDKFKTIPIEYPYT